MAEFNFEEQFEHIKKHLITSVKDIFPIEGKENRLELMNIEINDNVSKDDFGLQKRLRMRGRSFTVPVYGEFRLVRISDKKVLDKHKMKILNLPKITERGSFIVKGNEYQVGNQLRLESGAYTRVKANGDLEVHFNLAKGYNFRLILDPEKLKFYIVIGIGANVRLYSILKAFDVADSTMQRAWGKEVFAANVVDEIGVSKDLLKMHKTMFRTQLPETLAETVADIKKVLIDETEISKETTKRTLKKAFSSVKPETIIIASQKLLKVSRKEEEPDNRDSLIYKTIHSVEDFIGERLKLSKKGIMHKVSRNLDRYDEIAKIMDPTAFSRPIVSFFTSSDLSNPTKQINPVTIIEDASKVTLMGEGGITNEQAVSQAARNLDPSHFGFLDPVKTPESKRVGIILQLPVLTKKVGNKLMTAVRDMKTGKTTFVEPKDIAETVIAFADQYDDKGNPIKKMVKVLDNYEFKYAKPENVRYVFPLVQSTFGTATNLIPFLDSIQGNRATIGSKMIEQAISLKHREAPKVRVAIGKSDNTMEKVIGNRFSLKATEAGTVEKITDDSIVIKSTTGKSHKYNIYKDFPLNEDRFFDYDVKVKVGDKIAKGQLLADSNFTKDGDLAIGVNLTTGYMPMEYMNFEDSVVVSESAAEKLTSLHLHTLELSKEKDALLSKKKYAAYYPQRMSSTMAAKLDENGVVKKGQKVVSGDILATCLVPRKYRPEEDMLRKLSKSLVVPYVDKSLTWDHDVSGVVADVVDTRTKVIVNVRTEEKASIGDKLVGRHGNKGVIAEIRSDSDMPATKDGKSLQIIMNPVGVPSRINPSQILETAASKIADKTGKPFVVHNFDGKDNAVELKKLMKGFGIEDTEELVDPRNGKSYGKVLTGDQYLLKLEHVIEHKYSTRGTDSSGWDANLQPSVGDKGQSIGPLKYYALLSHGARANLREMSTYKAERNDELWRAIERGETLPVPKPTFAFEKFTSMIKGLGVDVKKDGRQLQLIPMTTKEIVAQSNGEVKNAKMVLGKNLNPEKGGFFVISYLNLYLIQYLKIQLRHY